MNINYQDKICIIGYSGSGKSTLTKYFVKSLYPMKMVIVDPISLFSEKKPIDYTGIVTCLNPSKNKVCVKIHTDEQLDKIINNINHTYSKMILVVDEIDNYIDTHFMLDQTSKYFQQGRNYGHGGIFTVRQVGRLNKQILSNSHYLFLFKIFNKNDIIYLESITGLPLADKINSLPLHNFLIIDLWNSEIKGNFILNGNLIVGGD